MGDKVIKVALLASNNNRAKAYIQNLAGKLKCVDHIFYLADPPEVLPEQTVLDKMSQRTSQVATVKSDVLGVDFNEKEHVLSTAKKCGIDVTQLESTVPNTDEVAAAVSKYPGQYLIYAGPGGHILKRSLLETGKVFLHAHPGWLPDYKGSTTVYYSLLNEYSIGCSIIVFAPQVDSGPVLFRKKTSADVLKQLQVESYDYHFDPLLRTSTFLDFFKNGAKVKPLISADENHQQGDTYYIIHPVLKHIAIGKIQKNREQP